jgi:uncharacterized protein
MTLGRARVDIRLLDLSLYVEGFPKGYITTVIQSERGPINEPMIVSSWEEFERIYGKKVDWTDDPLVCEYALKQGARLIVIRVAHYEDIQDSESLTALSSYNFIKDESGEEILKVIARDEGAWGDNLEIDLYDSDYNSGTRFDMRVTLHGQSDMNEYYTDIDLDPTSDRYVINVINGGAGHRSNLIQVEATAASGTLYPDLTTSGYNYGGVTLVSGSNGGTLEDHDYIGDSLGQTGFYAAGKSKLPSIDFMLFGTSSVVVIQELVNYCEMRGDMIAYAMIPVGLDPEDAVEWRMGLEPYSHEPFDSHRLVLTYGRPLVYDSRDDTQKYINNLGHFAACIARTDNYYDYHYAPAGPRRGVVDFVLDLDYDAGASIGYADLMAEKGINYLTISHHPGIEGAMFWEQRTTLRQASAFRELNVVRYLTWMRIELYPVLNTFLFEPNEPRTWREIHRTLTPAMDDYLSRGCIYDYLLQTDKDAYWEKGTGVLRNAVLNTGQTIDQGMYKMRIYVQPTRTIYYLQCDITVTRTGQAFIEYTPLRTLPAWVRS